MPGHEFFSLPIPDVDVSEAIRSHCSSFSRIARIASCTNAGYCYRRRGVVCVPVCLLMRWNEREPCRSSRGDRNAVWGPAGCEPKESWFRWRLGSPSRPTCETNLPNTKDTAASAIRTVATNSVATCFALVWLIHWILGNVEI